MVGLVLAPTPSHRPITQKSQTITGASSAYLEMEISVYKHQLQVQLRDPTQLDEQAGDDGDASS